MSGAARATCTRAYIRADWTLAPAVTRIPDPPQPDRAPAAEGGFGFDFALVPARHRSGPAALGARDDPAEGEADRAAERVMRGEPAELSTGARPPPPCPHCNGGSGIEIRRKSAFDTPSTPVPFAVEAALASPGHPLEPRIRAKFEPLFGHDFAQVRVHDDARTDIAARAIGARAFALDRHIGFATGEYAPTTHRGGRLLAHELAHVVQPSGAGRGRIVRRTPYETHAVELNRGSIANLTSASYWLIRTTDHYALVMDPRMSGNLEERDAVLAALWSQNPPSTVNATIELNVSIPPRPPTQGSPSRPEIRYRFLFNRPPRRGEKPQLFAQFVGTGPNIVPGLVPVPIVLPADYRSRDAGDFLLEELRGTARAPTDRIGSVTLPALPADERLAVNLAILEYFRNGSRNTEVDAIVPVGVNARTVLFTLRFGTGNNVTVERIGEAGTQPGQVNTGRIDVTRVNGFPGFAAADHTLRRWWQTRYPAGGVLQTPAPLASAPATPAANPAAVGNSALIGEMNRVITAGCAAPGWFRSNYQIEVMNAHDTDERLRRVHRVPAAFRGDTEDFAVDGLASLEVALQTLSQAELRPLRRVKVGRKRVAAIWSGGAWQMDPAADGVTMEARSNEPTIIFCSNLTQGDAHLFTGGGARTALPDSARSMVHEFGHVAEARPGVQAAFSAWEQAHPQTAPTQYAADYRGIELFAEFYSLFHTDPHFLCVSAPQMYAWFLQLARTGHPPATTALFPSPAPCPP